MAVSFRSWAFDLRRVCTAESELKDGERLEICDLRRPGLGRLQQGWICADP